LIRRGRYHRSRGIRQTRGKRYRASHDDPAGGSMILFAVSTLSYTDTRTIGWPFLIIIPAISAASAIAYRLPIHLEQESADLGSLARREHFLPHLWCSGTPLGSYTAGGPDAARWFASESTTNAEHVSSESSKAKARAGGPACARRNREGRDHSRRTLMRTSPRSPSHAPCCPTIGLAQSARVMERLFMRAILWSSADMLT
jgi:hypothetical protein